MAAERIYEVMANIINLLAGDLQASSTKAYLARLRHSINKDVQWTTGVLPVVFASIPEEYLGKSGDLTPAERAIVTSLQLFALHQQGSDQLVHLQSTSIESGVRDNLGASLRALRVGDDTQAVDRSFNAMITSTNFNELSNHLRHLIKLLKSRTDAKVDYAQLAQDLFWFQVGNQSAVRLRWSRSYYKVYKDQGGEESNEE